MIEQVPRI